MAYQTINTAANYTLTGLQAFQAATPATFAAGGSLSALGAAIPIAGAVLAAAPLAINLIKCGTITGIGCTKRADTEIDKQGEILARQVIYGVESGKLDAATAKSQIAQIWQAMNQSWQQAQRSGYTSSFDGFCGPGGSPPYYQQIGVPANSQAATYLCGQTLTRQQMFTVLFPQLIDQIAAKNAQQKAASIAAPAGGASPVSVSNGIVSVGGVTLPLPAVALIGAGLLFLLVR